MRLPLFAIVFLRVVNDRLWALCGITLLFNNAYSLHRVYADNAPELCVKSFILFVSCCVDLQRFCDVHHTLMDFP